jgi:putative membrane protein
LTGTNGARFFGNAPFLFVPEAAVDASGNRHVLDHLSNERTLLAWIRTSIAVIALGIAINRVSLFLMEIHQLVPELRAVANSHIKGLGVGLIVLGIVVLAGAFWHYLSVSRAIDAETYRPSTLAMAVTSGTIVVMGVIALVWLF